MKKALKIKTEYNKKRYGHHHKRNRSFNDTYLPYLPMTIILFISVFISGYTPKYGTLAYATEMSSQSLLSATNNQRVGNNKSTLSINSQLSSAAQAKANDMVSRNYWSHNTPDGNEPWVFINGAGYSYMKAGENLAYGFSTSSDTINGWMNSPTHKDNLLDSEFSEVGFGFANSSNFNNAGEETVVVAMYGKPYVLASTSQPTTQQTPQPSTPATTTPQSPSQPTPEIQKPPENPNGASLAQLKPETQNPITEAEKPTSTEEIARSSSKPVTRAETLNSKLPTWSIGVITFSVALLIVILLLRHGLRFRKLIKDSGNFITHHPLIDSTILALIILGVTLLRNVGNIL